MKIYLVRHGETDWNQAGLLQGQTDIALNAQGLEQAREAAERLKEVPFEIAFCSPLIRAKRTAETIIGDSEDHPHHRRKTQRTEFRSLGRRGHPEHQGCCQPAFY